jgi:hypothetical protein
MATIAELTAKLGLDNSDFDKGISQSTGQIKDFQSAIADGLKSLKQMGAALKEKTVALQASITATIAQTRAMSASQLAFKAATLATNAFKIALASTGIGVIVIALGSLIAYLTQTESGMAKIDKVVKPVVQIFERLKGVLQVLGESVFAGIAQMLNGELKEGFKTLASGAKQAGTNTVNAFKDGLKFGGELADLIQKIKKEELELETLRGKSRNQIALLSEQARDQSKSEAQRADAAKKAIALINELTAKEQDLIKLRIRQLEIEQSANDTDQEGKLEMIRLQNELLDVEASAARERVRLNGITAKGQQNVIDLLREERKEREKIQAIVAGKRDPFSLEESAKYSDEVLKNIKGITEKLIDPALKGAMSQGIIIPQEALDRMALAREEQAKFNQEIGIANTLTSMLGSTFQSAFEGMLNSGKVSFKGIIDGLKALIIKLIAAAAAALALNVLLGGVGLAGGKFGGMEGFKTLFSSLSGIPKFAEGGMVNGLTMAVLGDNPSKKEAIIPFEKMGSFLSQYGTGGGNMKVEVVGSLRGEDIFFSGTNYQNGRNKIIAG